MRHCSGTFREIHVASSLRLSTPAMAPWTRESIQPPGSMMAEISAAQTHPFPRTNRVAAISNKREIIPMQTWTRIISPGSSRPSETLPRISPVTAMPAPQANPRSPRDTPAIHLEAASLGWASHAPANETNAGMAGMV